MFDININKKLIKIIRMYFNTYLLNKYVFIY